MIEVVWMFPTYKHNAINNQSYNHRPETKVLASLDSEEFAVFQHLFRNGGAYTAMPAWSAEGIYLRVTDDDLQKLDGQFINIPRSLSAKERYYTGEMAMFIIMNYQVNL